MTLVRAGFRLHTREVGGKPVTRRKELQLGIDQLKAHKTANSERFTLVLAQFPLSQLNLRNGPERTLCFLTVMRAERPVRLQLLTRHDAKAGRV